MTPTSRELMIKTLEFDAPDRIPLDLWVLPWANSHYPGFIDQIRSQFPPDMVGAPSFLAEQPKTVGDQYAVGTSIDEWGCIRENIHEGVIGEVKEPLIKDWKTDLDKVVPPYAWLTINREKINEFCASTDKFVTGGVCPKPFEQMQYIRGSENLYRDLAEQPEELNILIDRMHHFYLQQMELWCQTDVDAVNLMDDWGAQRSLLISPRMWRKIFKPLYRDYCELAHSYGKYVFMHSDGYIADIYPDLIEIGVNALNSQLFVMDIEELGETYGGKITFWGEIDRQHLLPQGSVADIHAAVNRVFKACYHNGGVIGQCEFGPGAKAENALAVYQAWSQIQLTK